MAHYQVGSRPNFSVTKDQLCNFITSKHPTEALNESGGIESLAEALCTDLSNGIPDAEKEQNYEHRKQTFGRNEFPSPKIPSIFQLWWEAFKDEMIIILTIAAIVSLILGVFFPEDGGEAPSATGGIEGAAILGAVVIVTTVQAVNNYSQEKQFQSLNKQKNDIKIKVKRGGQSTQCQIGELVVGDVVILATGNQVPADGFFINGYNCQCDESNMTGEPDPNKKSVNNAQMLSGCHVLSGDCTMLVTAVGTNSLWGKAMKEIDEASDRAETPLQKKLGLVARHIGFLGLGVAAVVFVVLIIYWIIDQVQDGFEWEHLTEILQFFIIAVTIVVVAVPEGLPLAVTIALAFSMKKMMKDNNFVRYLPACETMGGATQICSDKTGTLTQNRMNVTCGIVAGVRFDNPNIRDLNRKVHHILTEGIAKNSTSYLAPPKKAGGPPVYVDQPTECALLVWINKLNVDYEQIRANEPKVLQRFPFSSARKRMSCVVAIEGGGYRLYTKGAAEMILSRSVNMLQENGSVTVLDESTKEEYAQQIEQMASRGLRCIAMAYRDFEVFDVSSTYNENEGDEPPEIKLTLVGIAGIEDPVRPEVPDAVKTCQNAGITVRMVTGDNILTARSIAKQCGILTGNGMALEGPEFAKMSDSEIDTILPRLQVLARSTPSDKIRLVKRLRANSELVAVTGDGTNDAPALKGAHIGLAMGSGTDVAKEASDIIIQDDNFTSIVKAVMWGRCIFDNIRKFLQFQLTVNVAALAIAAVSALADKQPLNAVQLLWVNLIMDSFGALALATEAPTMALLNRPPLNVAHKKTSLLSPEMWKMILGQGLYQVLVLLFGVFFLEGLLADTKYPVTSELHLNTLIFNSFIACQLFNLVACRKVNPKEFNILSGIHTNWIFIVILIFEFLVQFFLIGVCFDKCPTETDEDSERLLPWLDWIGTIFETQALSIYEHLICTGVGFVGLIWGIFLRFIPTPEEKRYKGDVDFDLEEENEEEGEKHSLLKKN